jgi:hypothetical protein
MALLQQGGRSARPAEEAAREWKVGDVLNGRAAASGWVNLNPCEHSVQAC